MVKKIFRTLFILFIFSILNAESSVDYKPKTNFAKDCNKERKQYSVKAVFDGDTILIVGDKKDTKIRLLGIDAFEHEQIPYGPKAKDFLAMLVLNKNVCVETDVQENDIYGRTLGYVFVNSVNIEQDVIVGSKETLHATSPQQSRSNLRKSSGIATPHSVRLAMTFINEELVKNGFAILYDFPPNIKYLLRLKKAQVFARQNMLGVWEKHDYIIETPAQWRHEHPFKKNSKKKKLQRL
ncbi:MAG: thermonuclease family protein [Candidatus Melainabacteria bacterium]|nr:thermonuclease family protein [Candidatus Melainabacteria bacterium]